MSFNLYDEGGDLTDVPLREPHFVHPEYVQTVNHLRAILYPLVSMENGRMHPSFPLNFLSYHLLTADELDDLAEHYHQTQIPTSLTLRYPRCVPSWEGPEVDLDTKRRRFGRFIGMRGCDSPVATTGNGEIDEDARRAQEAEKLKKQMEKEWEDAVKKARGGDDDEAIQRKTRGYR